MNRIARHLLGALAVLLTLCSTGARAAPLEVLSSFSILSDFIAEVGGDRVHITTLVLPGEDAHNFQPRPSDARRLRDAKLVVASGLGFDPWMQRLARSAGYTGALVIASDGIEPIAALDAHDHGHGKEAHRDAIDPHAWQDVRKAAQYVANIARALAEADPAGAQTYQDNARRYQAELAALDAEIRQTLARIPPDRRKVVSGHDAFGYFSHAYGVRFLAPAGISNQSEASASGVARLIRQLRKEQVPAVFVENIADPRLIERIRKESGARLGGTLYSDALSPPDGPAATYVAMMRHNLATLLSALAPNDAAARR